MPDPATSHVQAAAAARRAGTAPYTAVSAVIALALTLASTNAMAQDLRSEVDLSDGTIAHREMQRSWDAAKQYGADSVLDHARRPWQPDGLRMGNFLLFPSAGASIAYDDNVYGTPGRRTADMLTRLDAGLRIVSDLPRHQLDFAFGGRFTRYARETELDNAEGHVRLSGSLHIDHAHTLAAVVSSDLVTLDSFAPNNPLANGKAVRLWYNRASASLKRDAGRLWAAVALNAQSWRFDTDEPSLGLAAANLDKLGSSLMVGYRFSPGYDVVAKLQGARQVSPDPDATPRDGWGYSGALGLRAEINPLLKWSLFAGYARVDFDHNLPPTEGLVGSATLTWLATRRLTFDLKAERDLTEAATLSGTNGLRDDSIALKASYEAWRNLMFTIEGQYHQLEFSGGSRRDDLYAGQFGIEYLHSKNSVFSLTYGHQHRASEGSPESLQRNTLMLGAKIRF